ncbi:MAG: DMT family transporter [Pseudomonadota bacterium]
MSQAVKVPVHGSEYGRGVLYVLVAGILWSTVGLGIRLIEDATAWQILLYRAFTLTPFIFLVLWVRSGGHPIAVIRDAGPSALVAGFALFFAYAGGIYAIQTTTVASALLIFASAPMFAALLGRVVLGERVRPATGIAIGAAVIGVGVMVSDGLSSGNFIGDLAALGSALGFAIYTVILRRGRSRDMMPSVFLSGLVTIAMSSLICLSLGYSLVLTVQDASVAMTMGVGQVGLGLVFYTLGSKTVPSAEMTLLSLGEVLLGPVWVWMYMSEVPTQLTVIGGGILLAAIIGNAMTGLNRKAAVPASVDP